MNPTITAPFKTAVLEELPDLIPHLVDAVRFGYALGNELTFQCNPEPEFYPKVLGDNRHNAINKKFPEVMIRNGFTIKKVATRSKGYFFVQVEYGRWQIGIRKIDEAPFGKPARQTANYLKAKREMNELLVLDDNLPNQSIFAEIVHTPRIDAREELGSIEMQIITPSGTILTCDILELANMVADVKNENNYSTDNTEAPKPEIEVITDIILKEKSS
jgi:hypothetical protein